MQHTNSGGVFDTKRKCTKLSSQQDVEIDPKKNKSMFKFPRICYFSKNLSLGNHREYRAKAERIQGGESTRPGAREAGQGDAELKTRNRRGEQQLYWFVLIGMKQTVT